MALVAFASSLVSFLMVTGRDSRSLMVGAESAAAARCGRSRKIARTTAEATANGDGRESVISEAPAREALAVTPDRAAAAPAMLTAALSPDRAAAARAPDRAARAQPATRSWAPCPTPSAAAQHPAACA